ncbi:hypothetical protein EG68_06806 [Paragonimus skrjabini miyazakii]|uniref:Uncharacterized protein n=1 Tax=Paragonimus skrjabini miyazakii TaxID=59628 RepID=A0A8S9Z3U6_9TREM|nr:hypothetical protein EG68_06806 [Paragonimus skrjabini miyazakii]
MTKNTSFFESECTSKASFDSLQGDKTTIPDLVEGIVSTLSTVTSGLQALETQTDQSLQPPNSSKPAVMPAMFKSPARTQEDLDAREPELATSDVYDVFNATVYVVITTCR